MAPVEATIALSHLEGVSDSARARELYKYYQPSAPVNSDSCFALPSKPPPDEVKSELNVKSDVTSSKISSPDTALTAFCQLTTWRTGAQRAMISVIDAETQYFLAEGTKTVDLVDNTKHATGDEIWMGCSSVTKAGRLCERTIAVAPTSAGDYPCFIVNDLSTDERFNSLSFVTGPPFLRFYAGVPMITKRGIPIGSLFIVDDRIGDGLSSELINFMGTMASTIMKHMEMVREVEEHRRGMKMSRGLASFVEGRAELAEAEADADNNEEGAKIAGQFESEDAYVHPRPRGSGRNSVSSAKGSIMSLERKEHEYSAALTIVEKGILAHGEQSASSESESARPDLVTASQPDSFGATSISGTTSHDFGDSTALSPPAEDTSEATSMKILFSRAANLIREAFEVDGGAVFYDAQTGFSSDLQRKPEPASPNIVDSTNDSQFDSYTSGEEFPTSGDIPGGQIPPPAAMPTLIPAGSPKPGPGGFSMTTGGQTKTVEILGFSTSDASSINGDPAPGPHSFTPLQEKALHVLLKRYPRGKLWTFDSDGAVSSSSEEEVFKLRSKDPIRMQKDLRKRKMRSQRNKSDAIFLSKHFPGVRQLLFVPLWDAGRSHWLSGCFAWSTEPTRILSRQNELAFLTAFGNSVMAEWARIDTEIADQKKGDFIGSISHELRSPLHGILASAEFLTEVLSGWEGHLVETIDSCGRTLLDTINHILDFSKINHFEKNWRKSRRGGNRALPSGEGPLALRQSDLPMLNLFQDVDISVICEEVVESVFAGHVFQNITAQSFDAVPNTQDKMSDFTKSGAHETRMHSISSGNILADVDKFTHAGVSVVLDVDLQNYHFTTQPGALRRLIMNLLGNALKYTSHGYVKIKLEAQDIEPLYLPGSSGGETIPRSRITLTVADTGRGISSEFLRSKLFMPFAQENSLSNGTGLGLSIVRKIVSLLEGDITIDSEVGRGTQVKVSLPLLREVPRTAGSGSTSSSKTGSSMPRDVEECIVNLRLRASTGLRVFLSGFDTRINDPVIKDMLRSLKASISTFLTHWYGFQIIPAGRKAHIIISNEESPIKIAKLAQHSIDSWGTTPSILVLCSHNTKFDRLDVADSKVGYVAKPVGPVKLAKAIIQCLDGAPPNMTPGPDMSSPALERKVLTDVFEELSLSSRQGGEVLDNSRMATDSDNARKALESPTPQATTEEAEYPFPNLDKPAISKSASMPAPSSPTALKDLTTTSPTIPPLAHNSVTSIRPLALVRQPSTPAIPQQQPQPKQAQNTNLKTPPKSPSLLVVDDNQINQRLLSTYLKRRKFEVVDQANNGLEAVNMVRQREEIDGGEGGYDIIFMDITMPVLDGFGATRQIRSIEAERGRRGKNVGGGIVGSVEGKGVESRDKVKRKGPALIIAFTGRSSIEDQNEAVRVGLDLFMTKPVAFKEVGRIIDNWVCNQVREVDEGGGGNGGGGGGEKGSSWEAQGGGI